ncbi:TIGR00266 family protein [Coralloluteibacterium stylophorae]|uniref:TIGR00266 family protein n=1 Tax=Coralloluteibacterium stylophorae TaxID=1776034 RepID=A0AAP2C924_9GAMM|nr:TIGR00266 family protein [Coralloluteibacterium stylophorae]MBS7456109.1 TIGR00266 family protein [Coralloluteibacterium stylophorae]
MHQWYLSYDGKQEGPLDEEAAIARARAHPQGHCWRAGFAEWIPIASCAELGGEPTPAGTRPPPMSQTQRADVIDYRLYGEDMQFVEVELDPGESAIAEAGALMYKDAAVGMETIFGDGTRGGGGGFLDKLVGAGKRVITGESLFTTVFTHGGQGKARVAFAAPYPGTIVPLSLSNFGGRVICQKDSFLCAARGVSIGIHFQRKVLTALFGGEGFIMQKLEGDGLVFVHAGGTVVERELRAGERLDVDTGCVVAYTDGVDMDIRRVGGVKSMFFGGEGLFLATLTGPGKVWLQSLPFSRLASRMFMAAPQAGGQRQGEGSVLGSLGDLLGGDRGF